MKDNAFDPERKELPYGAAEEAEIQITPGAGDILQVGETQPVDIPAHETGYVRAVLLTQKDSTSIRELTVTYYIWGLPFTVRTTGK